MYTNVCRPIRGFCGFLMGMFCIIELCAKKNRPRSVATVRLFIGCIS